MGSLKLVSSYLSNRKQRVKIDDNFSSWEEIIFGIPKGSILGPLVFNIPCAIYSCLLMTLILQIMHLTINTIPLKTQDLNLVKG